MSVPTDIPAFVDEHNATFVAAYVSVSQSALASNLRRRRIHAGLCAALLASLFINFCQLSSGRPVRLLTSASDDAGSIAPVATIYKPINTLPEVERWVTDASVEAFTLDFSLLDKQFAAIRPNFTEAGWRGFQKALNDSGMLKQIVDNKYQMSTVPTAVAVESTLAPAHATKWTFQLPIATTYIRGSKTASKLSTLDITIVRQDPSRQSRGLGIDNIKVE